MKHEDKSAIIKIYSRIVYFSTSRDEINKSELVPRRAPEPACLESIAGR